MQPLNPPTLPTPKVKVQVETPQQRKFKSIAVGIVLIIFTPLIVSQVLRIADLHFLIPIV